MYYRSCTARRSIDVIERIISGCDNFGQAKVLIQKFVDEELTDEECLRIVEDWTEDTDNSLGIVV